VSTAYLEERGFLAGRSAYAQVVGAPVRRLWLLGRVSWVHEEVGGLGQDEGSVRLGGRAELTSHLSLRLSRSGRSGLAGTSSRRALISATLAGGF